MAVDLIGYSKMDDQMSIQDAAVAGFRSMEKLILQLNQNHQKRSSASIDCREIADHAVSKFKKMISILNRTGHARFRRGPTAPSTAAAAAPAVQLQSLTLDFTKPTSSISAPISSANSSFISSMITGDGSLSNGPAISTGKQPISSVCKKQCHGHAHSEGLAGKFAVNGGRCHCSKRRKNRVKRSIRVPAISSKMADIPQDEHSWRKYGQKPIKGSPYPRGYYKCSSLRGCPARKHVERASDDPSMLIVTYEGEHRHSQPSDSVAMDAIREI